MTSKWTLRFVTAMILVCIVPSAYSTCFAQVGEVCIYSFHAISGEKVEFTMATDSTYLALKISTSGKVDLIHKEVQQGSFRKSAYSFYLRAGGDVNEALDLNSVAITVGDTLYVLSQDAEGEKEFVPELQMTNTKTGSKTILTGESFSIEGSLLIFRDNKMLPVVE